MSTELAASSPNPPRIRLLVAEDEPNLRSALVAFLGSEDAIELVAEAGDAEEAIELAIRQRPDVALLDVKMPKGGGPAAAKGIRSGSPDTRIVALSAYDDRANVLEMLRAGAIGYLVKGTSAAGILNAIIATSRGQGALSVEVAADVIQELATQLQREELASEGRRRRRERVERLLRGTSVNMVFQPIVDLGEPGIVGAEALARFDPGGSRTPEDWLSEAEALGLRTDLELAAIRAALEQMDLLPPGLFLSVNLSPQVAVSPRFLDTVSVAPTDRVVIEVTEHAQVGDYDELNRSLHLLRERGVRLAIDDAGAGFASLQHIVRLAPDFIKLDITLTRHIEEDPTRRSLATALISFASEIGATMIAEGIESAAEFETLKLLGVTLGQGYFFGRPGPLPLGQPLLIG